MGVHQRGSHFPICVFTNNVGRRSPKKLEERKENKSRDHGTSRNDPKARKNVGKNVGSRDQRNGKACKEMQIRSKVGSRDQKNGGPQSRAKIC